MDHLNKCLDALFKAMQERDEARDILRRMMVQYPELFQEYKHDWLRSNNESND